MVAQEIAPVLAPLDVAVYWRNVKARFANPMIDHRLAQIAEPDVGVVATQAIVDVSYGPQALALLKQGMAPREIIKRIWEADPDPGYAGQSWPKAGRST